MRRLFSQLGIVLSLLFGGVLVLGPTPPQQWHKKVDTALLANASAGETQAFLVLLSEQASIPSSSTALSKLDKGREVFRLLQQTALRTQRNLLVELQKRQVPHRSLFIANAIYAEGHLELIEWLARRPEVRHIYANAPLRIAEPLDFQAETLEFRSLEWGLERIGADQVWALGYSGQGVVVGGQDTGVEWHHPAIVQQYRGWNNGTPDHNYHWFDAIEEYNPLNSTTNNPCGLSSQEPCDDNNHGTHTVGTMVGDDTQGNQIGVAPGAQWIAARNMERGWGSLYSYIRCFEWFLAPTDLQGQHPNPDLAPHVIANSWACPEIEGCNPDNFALMELAVKHLKAAGVVVVVSAGNYGAEGCGSVRTPAAIYEASFTVGATGQNDTITGFSSKGPVLVDGSARRKPDIAAPGASVRSSIRNGSYGSSSGTSMAGPHVAGVVALVISANPALAGQVELIESILERTARPMYSQLDCDPSGAFEIPNNSYGFGRIDALAAVQVALSLAETGTPSPKPDLQVFPNPFSLGQLRIYSADYTGPVHFQLFNTTGQLLFEERWNTQAGSIRPLFIGRFATGVYLYRFRTEAGEVSGKIFSL